MNLSIPTIIRAAKIIKKANNIRKERKRIKTIIKQCRFSDGKERECCLSCEAYYKCR